MLWRKEVQGPTPLRGRVEDFFIALEPMDTTTNDWVDAMNQADTMHQADTEDQVNTEDQEDDKLPLGQPPVDPSTLKHRLTKCLSMKVYLREKLIKAHSHLFYLEDYINCQ